MTTRQSITQANFIWLHHPIYLAQLGIVSIFFGFLYQSVGIGLASLFVLLAFSAWPPTAAILSIGFAIAWGMTGHNFATEMFSGLFTTIVVTLVAFIVGLGFNITGLAFINDMTRRLS